MTLNGLKNIIFDFGGVICDLHPQRCLDKFRQLGCEINMFPTQYSQFDGVFKQIDRGDISMEDFYESIRQQGKVPYATDEQIQQAWLSVLGDIPDERFEAFDKLRRNYRLYILSNCNDLHWEHLSRERMVYRGENIMHWFSQLFLSYKLHLEKPEPEIYQAVLDMAGIKADAWVVANTPLRVVQIPGSTSGIRLQGQPIKQEGTFKGTIGTLQVVNEKNTNTDEVGNIADDTQIFELIDDVLILIRKTDDQ